MEKTSTHPSVYKGVIDGSEKEFDVENVKEKFQVFIFYPSNWDDESFSLLSSFSSLLKQFSSSDCSIYGCSTDCPGSNLDWIKTKFGSNLPFPLLSDPSGKLAGRFSLFDCQERINMRSVVITDNQGIALEVINTSMQDEEIAHYALDLVKQTLEHRSRLLDKKCHFQQPNNYPGIDQKLEELANYSLGVVKQARSRARSSTKYRSECRSVSRGKSLIRMADNVRSYKDPIFESHMKRTEDRLMRGFF